jgi:uncharacterized protein YecE (DUF72 family)
VKVLAGTSGFSYSSWKGPFYPRKLPTKGMLQYYAQALPTVEINNTFYRLPSSAALAHWAEQVPQSFRFAIKASRRITHLKRLGDCGPETEQLLAATHALGEKLGSILFQTPPQLRLDLPRLAALVGMLPRALKAAFEFRHASWFHDEVFSLLGERNLALVISETDDGGPELPWTADWAYLRLRKSSYSEQALSTWAERLRAANLSEAQVFFKHEDQGVAPKLALAFLQRFAASEC